MWAQLINIVLQPFFHRQIMKLFRKANAQVHVLQHRLCFLAPQIQIEEAMLYRCMLEVCHSSVLKLLEL